MKTRPGSWFSDTHFPVSSVRLSWDAWVFVIVLYKSMIWNIHANESVCFNFQGKWSEMLKPVPQKPPPARQGFSFPLSFLEDGDCFRADQPSDLYIFDVNHVEHLWNNNRLWRSGILKTSAVWKRKLPHFEVKMTISTSSFEISEKKYITRNGGGTKKKKNRFVSLYKRKNNENQVPKSWRPVRNGCHPPLARLARLSFISFLFYFPVGFMMFSSKLYKSMVWKIPGSGSGQLDLWNGENQVLESLFQRWNHPEKWAHSFSRPFFAFYFVFWSRETDWFLSGRQWRGTKPWNDQKYIIIKGGKKNQREEGERNVKIGRGRRREKKPQWWNNLLPWQRSLHPPLRDGGRGEVRRGLESENNICLFSMCFFFFSFCFLIFLLFYFLFDSFVGKKKYVD